MYLLLSQNTREINGDGEPIAEKDGIGVGEVAALQCCVTMGNIYFTDENAMVHVINIGDRKHDPNYETLAKPENS